MRIVIAKRHGRRGAGLGNEVLPWAKGWIASQVLEAQLVGPSWGINARRYYNNFSGSRLDFLLEDALQQLPHYEFTEEEYRASGEIEFGAAIRKWATQRRITQKRNFIVCVEGMWGGYASIRCARQFLLAKLMNSRDALRNVYEVTSKLDRHKLFVAVHIRAAIDGFATPLPGESTRGKFNIIVPGEWYLWVCEALRKQFGSSIEFRFFTDRRGPTFDEAVRRFNPGQIAQKGMTECSDLLLMAQADLRVCSVSSYSMAGSFLSDGPYLWYEPQLTISDSCYTMWETQAVRSSSHQRGVWHGGYREFSNVVDMTVTEPAFTQLGIAMNIGDAIPENLVRYLEQRLCCHDPSTNLLEYGCVPRTVA